MRWVLAGMKVAIVAVYLVAIVLLVLAAAPLATGGIEVRVPEDVGQNWRLQGNYFYNPVEISIYNSGTLDIQGMVMRLEMRDANDSLITTSYSASTQLAAGQWSELEINVSVDTLALTRDQVCDMVFNTSRISMDLKMDAGMALGLMSISLDRTDMDNFTKSAMISDIHVGEEIGLRNVSGGLQATVPFGLSSAKSLEGTFARVDCIMRNSSALFSASVTNVELHPVTDASLVFLMDAVHAQAFLQNKEPVLLEMTLTYQRAEMPMNFIIPRDASHYTQAGSPLNAPAPAQKAAGAVRLDVNESIGLVESPAADPVADALAREGGVLTAEVRPGPCSSRCGYPFSCVRSANDRNESVAPRGA
jgi:hypothetical protein